MAASILSFPLPNPKHISIKASSSSTSSPATTSPPQVAQTLDEKFGRKGVKFTESGTVEMTVRNGSSLSLQISNGHVTSYKPKVHWKDDGFEEVLYTVPGAGEQDSMKGGIGLVLNEVPQTSSPVAKGSPVKMSDWVVKDVDADSIDALQVELGCISGTLDITYIVSLYPLSMSTAVIVTNNGKKPVNLTSAILSYLNFKDRGGSAIKGFLGGSYCTHPPLSSQFELVSPAEAMKPESPGWFSFSEPENNKPGTWAVQDQLYVVLKNKLSRVYAAHPEERSKRIYRTPPSKYETLDQGRGLVFRLIRMGYDDIYVSSPGSLSEKFGNDYFICTGPAAMLVPVVVNPGDDWRGAQVIEHDNL